MSGKQRTIIDFSEFGGPVHTGRRKGEMIRMELDLDSWDDASDTMVDVIIPEGTFTVTSGFFLGLFGKSVRQAGNREEFMRRYRFTAPETIMPLISAYADRALRNHTDLIRK